MIIRGGIWGRLKAGISTRCEAFKDWHNGSKFSKKYKGPVMLVRFNKFKAMEILSEMIPGEEYDIIVSSLRRAKRWEAIQRKRKDHDNRMGSRTRVGLEPGLCSC